MGSKVFALIFAAVFALGFTAGGVFGGLLPLWNAAKAAAEAKSRVPVTASVVRVSEERGSKGTTGTRVTYAYSYNGERFASEQISAQVSTSSRDNIGDWQRSWHSKLNRAKEQNASITAWVNPDDPSDAVLENEVRWGLVWFAIPFATLFTGVGLVAGYFFFRILLTPRDEMRMFNRGAAKVSENARTLRGSSQLGLLLFGIVWSLLCVPIAVVVWTSDNNGLARWITALFALLGVWMILSGMRSIALRRAVTEATIELDPQQPKINEAFRVRIRVPKRASGRDTLPLAFAVILQQTIRDERGSSTTTRAGASEAFLAERTQVTTEVSIYEAIVKAPRNSRASGGASGDLVHTWALQLPEHAAFATRSFEISIFAAEGATAAFEKFEARSFAESYQAFREANPNARDTLIAAKDCRIEVLSTQWSATFPRRGIRGGSLFLLIIAAGLFTWYGWQLLFAPHGLAQSVWAQAWPVFSGFALVLLVIHFATRTMRVQISRDGLALVRDSWLTQHTASIALARLAGFSRDERYRTSQGSASTQHSALYAQEISADLRERVTPTLSDAGMLHALQYEMTEALQRVRDFGLGSKPEPLKTHYSGEARLATWLTVGIALIGVTAINYALIFDRGSHFALLDKLYAYPYGLRTTAVTNVTSKSTDETQLIDAVHANNVEKAGRLLASGLSANTESETGDALIHIAARGGSTALVDVLIARGADINRKITRGQHVGATPLSSAIHCGDAKMAAHLISRGAATIGLNYYGWNYANLAAHVNCVACLAALKEAGVDLDAFAPGGRRETPIMTAARFAKHESITWLAKEGASLSKRDPFGYNVVGWAHFFKQESTKSLLLSLGADPDVGEKHATK